MSREIIQILRLSDRKVVEARLHDGVTLEELAEAEKKWKQARYEAVLNLLRVGIPREQIPEHWHWDWPVKVGQAGTIGVRLFGIECEGDWQGLMMSSLGYLTRLAPDGGKPLVYVKYIESAPWNVKSMSASPKFAAVGARLIETAVRQSVDEGYGGRVGLHSLPHSQQFYTRLWFANLGLDAAVENLPYLELTASESLNVLNGGISK